MSSRPEIEGKLLLDQLLEQSQDIGGAFAYITGGMGGGKTSAMFSLEIHTLINYPDQKIFFSEAYGAPLQCFKMNIKHLNFMVMEGSNVVFRDRNNHLSKVNLPVTYFKSIKKERKILREDNTYEIIEELVPDFDDLYNKAEPSKINVTFFGNRLFWMDFIRYLRHTGEWNHVFIDELGEITPAGTSGKTWKKISRFASYAKDIRKSMIKVICNTQSVRDSDYRVQDKFMFRIFLPGAMADPKHSRVSQGAIDNLVADTVKGNFGYISSRGKFGLLRFERIFKPNEKYNIEAYVPDRFEEDN